MNVIKITGRACFVVRSRPGLVVLDGKKVPCEEIARDIANHLALATGCNVEERAYGKLVKGWFVHDSSLANLDTEVGQETGKWRPVIRVTVDALTRTAAKVRQRADGMWEPAADGEPHDAEVADACE